jgi:hypothetical protein
VADPFVADLRAALGKVPSVEVRHLVAELARATNLASFTVMYDHIKDWGPVRKYDFLDGAEHITFINHNVKKD